MLLFTARPVSTEGCGPAAQPVTKIGWLTGFTDQGLCDILSRQTNLKKKCHTLNNVILFIFDWSWRTVLSYRFFCVLLGDSWSWLQRPYRRSV